jgi:cytochrome c553
VHPDVPAAPTRAAAPLAWLGLAALALAGGAVRADEIYAGHAKAHACSVCHGPLGLAVAPDAPNLADQPALYLTAQLRAYRSGARRHEVMSVMAKPLSDDDIAHLAAWFSAIRVEATPPRWRPR